MAHSGGKTLRHGQQMLEKEGKTFVSGVCVINGEKYTTKALNRSGLIEWLAGLEVIQVALSRASDTDREFLISGIGPKEQERIFRDPETDDGGFI